MICPHCGKAILTERQQQILALAVSKGRKLIARELGISPWTVQNHLHRARAKLRRAA